MGRALRLGQARGPSPAAKTGYGAADTCPILIMRSMYKIDGGGVHNSFSRKLPISLGYVWTLFWDFNLKYEITIIFFVIFQD